MVIQQEVLRFQVTMRDLVLMGVLNTRDYLLEDFPCIVFWEFFSASNKIKELTTGCVLKDHEYFGLGVNKLKKFDGVRIVESPQNFQLSLYFLKDTKLANFLLVKDLDSHLVTGLFMERHLDFSKCTGPKIFWKAVLTNSYFVDRHIFSKYVALSIL